MTPPDPTAGTGHSEAGRPTAILFVCLGNICRSPAAEGVFLHLIARQGLEQTFTVDSAGTGDWHVGRPADARMRSAAARRGIVLPSRARQITADDLSRFDHVLTMDRQNLEAVRDLDRRGEAAARIGPLTRYCRRYSVEEVPPIPTTAARRASIACSTCWRTPAGACWRPCGRITAPLRALRGAARAPSPQGGRGPARRPPAPARGRGRPGAGSRRRWPGRR